MLEFLATNGGWLALAAVFVAMHWFGMGCCGGHRHQRREDDGKVQRRSESGTESRQAAVQRCH